MTLTSPLCRIGRKRKLRELIKHKAPKQFDKYIEPFAGSGDIYFYMDIDVPAVINDLDKEIADALKILKSNPSGDINKFKNLSLEQVREFMKKSHSSPLDKLAYAIYDGCATFSGKGQGTTIYKNPNIEPKLRKLPEYAEYMKNTKVLNQDYASVIKNEDSAGSFIYLDPPYEDSKGLYKESSMDYEKLASILRNVKGKFLMSINDSANIRKIFKGFKITSISVEGAGRTGSDIGTGVRKELLIRNY
jgi:DNA adenine methylase